MNSQAAWINVILIFILVLCNGFFVATEFSMVKIRPSRISELASTGNKRAKTAQNLLGHLDAYLSACQLGITLASLGLGWVGEPTIARIIERPLVHIGLGGAVNSISFIIAFVLITFLHIVLGELTPKSLAIHRAERTILNAAPLLVVFNKLMYPFIWLLNATGNGFLHIIGIDPAATGEDAHTEEEIRILVNQSHRNGLIDHTEMTLFDNIFEFSNRIAREIMVPRIEMVAIPSNVTRSDVSALVNEFQHTRYPVVQGDKDSVIGYVHIKDIYLMQHSSEFDICRSVRPMIHVTETTEISDVLRRMQKHRTQIALVVDEFGGTAGVVTLEDIIEEIVGEIQDEFDDEMPEIVKEDNGYSVDARALVKEVNDLLAVKLEEIDVDTIGGWLSSQLPRTPAQKGDHIEKHGLLFCVEKMNQGQIKRVRIRTVPDSKS